MPRSITSFSISITRCCTTRLCASKVLLRAFTFITCDSSCTILVVISPTRRKISSTVLTGTRKVACASASGAVTEATGSSVRGNEEAAASTSASSPMFAMSPDLTLLAQATMSFNTSNAFSGALSSPRRKPTICARQSLAATSERPKACGGFTGFFSKYSSTSSVWWPSVAMPRIPTILADPLNECAIRLALRKLLISAWPAAIFEVSAENCSTLPGASSMNAL